MKKYILSLFAVSSLFVSCSEPVAKEETKTEEIKQETVNVYTHRFYDTDQRLFKSFEEKTGIKVNVKKDKADKLIALLQAEGESSQADLLITVDAGRLGYAKKLDLLQKFNSKKIDTDIPAQFIDKDHQWVALTQRARVIAYDHKEVKPSELDSYMGLTDKKWKGQINVRSAGNIYNQSLLASIIAHHGEEKALAWAKGMVANMAREPKGNDRDQVKQVALGEGNLAIINTYYLGKLLNSSNEMEANAGKSVALYFPNQDSYGTHINVSAAGITKYAPNKTNAEKLMEFLLSEEAQMAYAESNYEYPVLPGVEASELLKSWGTFKSDDLDLEKLSEYNQKAVEIFKMAGWK